MVFEENCKKKIVKGKTIIKHGIVLVLCTCLMFPVCFGAARYLPPVFHHPIWFWGEWGEERVHSWDPWDSDKYISIEYFWDSAVGRITETISSLWIHSPFAIKAEASELAEVDEMGDDVNVSDPVLTSEQGSDSFLVRKTIYKYYLTHLNFFGQRQDEQGFLLLPDYRIGHAHNIFLQYGTDFGIPVLALLVVIFVWVIVKSRILFCNSKDIEAAIYGMFFLIPMLFGMLEYSWGTGSLSIAMMFIAGRKIFIDNGRNC